MTSRVRAGVVRILKKTHLIRVARTLRDSVVGAVTRHNPRMREFYAEFVRPGDLVFDVGANVGNRTSIFLALGARVVAIEPQDACARELIRRFGRDPRFALVTNALGAEEGEGELLIGDESTVSSMATDWVERVKDSGRFGDLSWSSVQRVRTTTLDSLIASHGKPAFCKIDVEGYEAVVLRGLSGHIAALSFEFTPEFLDAAVESLRHLSEIGFTKFNYSLGESMQFGLGGWVDATEILRALQTVPDDAFGDVYAR